MSLQKIFFLFQVKVSLYIEPIKTILLTHKTRKLNQAQHLQWQQSRRWHRNICVQFNGHHSRVEVTIEMCWRSSITENNFPASNGAVQCSSSSVYVNRSSIFGNSPRDFECSSCTFTGNVLFGQRKVNGHWLARLKLKSVLFLMGIKWPSPW